MVLFLYYTFEFVEVKKQACESVSHIVMSDSLWSYGL